MDINNLFPSNFLNASDLQGQARRVIIESVAQEDVALGEIKPVCRFQGIPRGLVLNKTNAMVLASSFGPETTLWHGQAIELYPEKVMYQGRVVDGIRLRPSSSAATAIQDKQSSSQSSEGNGVESFNDDIQW